MPGEHLQMEQVGQGSLPFPAGAGKDNMGDSFRRCHWSLGSASRQEVFIKWLS